MPTTADTTQTRVGSSERGGRWALLAGRSTPGFESGLHRHAGGAKAFYVIDGEYEFYGDRQ